MSQEHLHIPQDDSQQQSQSKPFAGQRQHTAADFRPTRLRHQNSTATSSIGRYATACSREMNESRPRNGRSNTAFMRMQRTGTSRTGYTNFTNDLYEGNERAEKKQEQTVDVDNEYFALNPWYNQQKNKPVFGLASPLPRTVRKGMWWGRGDLRKSLNKVHDEEGADENDIDIIDQRADLDNELSNNKVQQNTEIHDPTQTNFTTEGHKPTLGRASTREGSQAHNFHGSSHESRQRVPVNEHGLTYNTESEAPTHNHFGMADGLPPLQELTSHDTTQTERENYEIRQREHQAQQDYYNQYRNPIAKLRAQYPQAPAEFLATFIYLFLGICVNLSVATSEEKTGSFETQAWGWGFAVMAGIYLAGGVSGAHLSPTISISLTIYRGFPWKMAIVYISMQMLAGLCAGALAFAIYREAIYAVDPNLTIELTGGSLFPKGPSFSTAGGFLNDFVYMAVWVCITFALGDDQNSPPGQGMTALIFGFTSFLTMVALGYNTGLGISPARDLGPRLVGLWVGYQDAFKSGYWAYGPWGASISGALFGGFIYDMFVFVGGESPVNYRWPQPGDIKWKAREKKNQVKDKIQRIA